MKKVVFFSIIGLICLAAILFISFRLSYIYYRIPQNGMFPTLPAGSLLFAKYRPYNSIADVKRGDIISYRHILKDAAHTFMWRVIGLPHDTLTLNGTSVFINRAELKHSIEKEDASRIFIKEETGDKSYTIVYSRNRIDSLSNYIVGPDELFVLGDNRDSAYDSRSLGPVHFSSIIGKFAIKL